MKRIWISLAVAAAMLVTMAATAVGQTDQVQTGTITGNGQTVCLSVAAGGSGTIQVSGTYVADLAFKGTSEAAGTNRVVLPTLSKASVPTTTLSGGTTGQFDFGAAGQSQVCVESTAYTSGTATITIRVSQGGQVVAVVGIPGGGATAARQDTGNASLASIDGKTPALVGGRQPVDGSGVTQPISGTVTANAGTGNFIVVQPTGTNLHVVCDSGCGGAATFTDNSIFTAGTTAVNITAGIFNDALAAVTSGNAAAPRITDRRGLHVNFRNAAGTEIGTAAAPVRIDPTGTTTQPISAVSLPLPAGAATAATQTDRTQKTQLTDGTRDGTIKAASTAAVAADTALVVAISPNNTPVLPSGAATLAEQQIQTARLPPLSFGRQPVEVNATVNGGFTAPSPANAPMVVAVSPFNPSGSGTLTGPGSITIEDTLNMGSAKVEVSVGTFTDITVTVETTIDYGGAWTTVPFWIGTELFTAPKTITGTSILSAYVAGALQTRFRITAVSGAGTATITIRMSPAALPISRRLTPSALPLIGALLSDGTNDVTVKAASAAAGAADKSLVVGLSPNSPVPPGTNTIGTVKLSDGVSTVSATIKDGSTAALPVDTSIVVGLSPNSPLPAGTNGIGKLTANAGVTIGAVEIAASQTLATVTNVATIGTSITPGTAAAHLGKAEDAAAASGDTGVAVLLQRKDTNATLTSADGDYVVPAADNYGAAFHRQDHPNRIRCTVTVSTATTIQALGGSCATPGAGLSIYITDIKFSVSAAGIAADAFPTLKYGTGGTCGTGTTVFWGALSAAAIRASDTFNTPIKIPANNEVCWISSTAGSKFITITGYVAQ